MVALRISTLLIAILLASFPVALPRVGSARADNGGSFSWFDDGNLTGWVPIVGWNNQTGQPQHAQSCQVVNGEYSLTTCEPLYRLHNFTDFAYEAQARVVKAAAQPIWGINFRVNPASPAYASIVAITGDPYTLAQGYDLEMIGGSPYLFLCTETCRVLSSNSTYVDPYISHRLRIVASGSIIKGYLDNSLTVEADDSTFSQGLIGLFSIPNGCSSSGCAPVTTNFDNVTVTPQNTWTSAQHRYVATITETGLPSGTKWSVSVQGIPNATAVPVTGQSNMTFELLNGTNYVYTVAPVANYTADSYSGKFNIAGAPWSLTVKWTVETSAQGPPGPQGPSGAQGSQGSQGPQGTPGNSVQSSSNQPASLSMIDYAAFGVAVLAVILSVIAVLSSKRVAKKTAAK